MTNAKYTKHALLASVMAMLLCFTMLLGTTFAWFTDSAVSGNNIIKTGNLDMKLSWRPYGTDHAEEWAEVTESTVLFGKDALYEPGYTEAVWLKVENLGSLAFRYDLAINVASEKQGTNKADEKFSLSDYLEVKYMTTTSTDMESNYYTTRESLDSFNFGGVVNSGVASLSDDVAVIKNGVAFSASDATNGAYSSAYVLVVISMPTTVTNDANHNGTDIPEINFSLTAVATQLAYESDSFDDQYDKDATYPEINTVDTWDGTADISWYLENPDATEYTLSTAEALAGLAALVDGTAPIPADVASEITLPVTFDGKIVKLEKDVDLYCEGENGEPISFDPIGYGYDVVFKGTFDGQGHTIFNLYQNGWALGLDYSTEGGGLFASVVDATIKNVAIDGAEIVMECIDMGVLVGYSYGNCTYENISVSNSTIANYQRYTGGVVGEVNGTQTFKNVDVASDVVVSSLWGDFDCSLGGIVGGKWGDATLTFEDCDVACELNTYNDVTSSYQWYAYRRAGMLIGNSEETVTAEGRTSATASYLTATNCTVTYGDWANYTYCEFAGTSWPYVRVQGGYSCDPYSNPRYGVATDANGNKAVDDTHVHNDGEDHNILLVFDQLFGGGQGVYGTATHDGVTVIYNNK